MFNFTYSIKKRDPLNCYPHGIYLGFVHTLDKTINQVLRTEQGIITDETIGCIYDGQIVDMGWVRRELINIEPNYYLIFVNNLAIDFYHVEILVQHRKLKILLGETVYQTLLKDVGLKTPQKTYNLNVDTVKHYAINNAIRTILELHHPTFPDPAIDLICKIANNHYHGAPLSPGEVIERLYNLL